MPPWSPAHSAQRTRRRRGRPTCGAACNNAARRWQRNESSAAAKERGACVAALWAQHDDRRGGLAAASVHTSAAAPRTRRAYADGTRMAPTRPLLEKTARELGFGHTRRQGHLRLSTRRGRRRQSVLHQRVPAALQPGEADHHALLLCRHAVHVRRTAQQRRLRCALTTTRQGAHSRAVTSPRAVPAAPRAWHHPPAAPLRRRRARAPSSRPGAGSGTAAAGARGAPPTHSTPRSLPPGTPPARWRPARRRPQRARRRPVRRRARGRCSGAWG